MPQLIKKKIHYCWYGQQNKNALIVACLQSWKEYLPDYEILEWNEDNSKFDCDFAQKAFDLKQWAFLSDYIRLKVLAEYGGIYLDTDMLFVKRLDETLSHNCFIGYQANGQIAAGIIGCVPNHPFIKHCVEKYRSMQFDETRLMNMAIPKIITDTYELYEDKADVHIYTWGYLYPYLFEDSLKGIDYRNKLTKLTIAVHMWNASWFTKKELAGFAFEQKKYFKGMGLLISYFIDNPQFIVSIPKIAVRYLTSNKKE